MIGAFDTIESSIVQSLFIMEVFPLRITRITKSQDVIIGNFIELCQGHKQLNVYVGIVGEVLVFVK